MGRAKKIIPSIFEVVSENEENRSVDVKMKFGVLRFTFLNLNKVYITRASRENLYFGRLGTKVFNHLDITFERNTSALASVMTDEFRIEKELEVVPTLDQLYKLPWYWASGNLSFEGMHTRRASECYKKELIEELRKYLPDLIVKYKEYARHGITEEFNRKIEAAKRHLERYEYWTIQARKTLNDLIAEQIRSMADLSNISE